MNEEEIWTIASARVAELERELDEAREEDQTSRSLLAKQCDLAREAELERDEARAEIERLLVRIATAAEDLHLIATAAYEAHSGLGGTIERVARDLESEP